ncbi:MAG: cache domain-containing protein [Chitinivibrionales bacterium]|nr:cache domain-containing protein [Chitinivibrionales bacterium]
MHMKHSLYSTVLVVVAVAFINGGAFGQTKQEKAVSLIKKGIDYIKAQGKEKAFVEFNNTKGQFIDGDLYIFVFDMKGLTLAHGANVKLVGQNQTDLMDADGKEFVKEFINVAKTKGSGWVDYKWTNPVSKKIQDKSTYIEKVEGDEMFLGCGFYK